MSAAPSRLSGGGRRRLAELSPRGMRLGLDAVSGLLCRLFPRGNAVPRILVGGTNGKGSVAAALSSILRASGVRAGLHTSPHLTDVTERIRIADDDVSGDALDAALDQVFDSCHRAPAIAPTYFEALTAAAEVLFEVERCRFAVVEVGLGGRLDATNAIDPVISVITSIGIDHVAELGDTEEAIAREKSGILRPHRPAIGGRMSGAARRVLEAEAERLDAPITFVADRAGILARRDTAQGQIVLIESPGARYELLTPLRGVHQAENLALVVLAAEELAKDLPGITAETIVRGVASTRWPGRLERFQFGSRAIWLDGCHNVDGAARLAEFLLTLPGRVDLIFGAMADKDIVGIGRRLFDCAGRIVLAAPSTERAATIEELSERLAILGRQLEGGGTPARALEMLSGPGPDVVAAGSLYLIGEIRSLVAPGGKAA